ncbi:Opsin Rh1 [Gryllus bimaculatus]|nr:Opsin Rh1 [Gryllus bimaculatus]
MQVCHVGNELAPKIGDNNDLAICETIQPVHRRPDLYALRLPVCVGAWLYCVCLCVPPLFGWSAYIPEGFLTSCSWDYLSRTPSNRAFYVYLLTLGFVAPVAVIAYCYVFILAAVLAHSREMRSVKHTASSTNLSELNATQPSVPQAQSDAKKRLGLEENWHAHRVL